MADLYLIFSHTLTENQIKDAKVNLKVRKIIELPSNLQKLWSNIPSNIKSLKNHLYPIKSWVNKNVKPGDYIFVSVVKLAFEIGCKSITGRKYNFSIC
ncbi:CRISPR-associated protein Csx20 [Halothermothrix orenii]|uniref:Uncharacterized protein n=1 Tax=Halothermothrix orenii (strain H 168 / OCM 544 / DSM 9562) TaxID=373903 RepID=B8CY89_HALOH|nr:CRISPR-associated protein Csx20 [Halothermothrix orenii]ACL70258.1 hypothetical protein Hore_15080 [Halothermothrix orenii H 168]